MDYPLGLRRIDEGRNEQYRIRPYPLIMSGEAMGLV